MGKYLIIGASNGIGKAIAEQLSSEHQVFGTYHQHPVQSDQITYQAFDVCNDSLSTDWLPQQLDGLVYCPGKIHLQAFNRIPAEQFVKDYELQVLGAIKTIQTCLPLLKQSPQANILLFSTVAVQTGMSFHSVVASSKGAIEGLSKALAAELAPNISVNCLAPSLTDTPLASSFLNTDQKREAAAQRHPLKRIGTAENVAALACHIITQGGQFMTGQIIGIDGGMSAIR
jgi:NAD(P)-dependent dehydrogenase (short-subunit alcohol dehydrogenase family)